MPVPTAEEVRRMMVNLEDAYNSGILKAPATLIDPTQFEFPSIPESFLLALEEENHTPQRRDCVMDQLDDPGRDTRRILYQESSYRWNPTVLGAPWGLNRAYEIARFVAAPDEVGIVKYIGTYAGLQYNEGAYITLDTTDPYVLEHLGLQGYWVLRLYQGTFQPLPPPDQNVIPAQIAGYPFPELAHWRDYRFQWGRTANDVFFIVPANHALRLYFVLEDLDASLILQDVMGRLVGFTQPIDTVPASKNVFYAW